MQNNDIFDVYLSKKPQRTSTPRYRDGALHYSFDLAVNSQKKKQQEHVSLY